MKPDAPCPEIAHVSEPNSHQEFLELCALSVGGLLPKDERSRLDRHLAVCSDCSDVLKDYQGIAQLGLSSIGDDIMHDLDLVTPLGSTSSAKKKLFFRLQAEGIQVRRRVTASFLWPGVAERFLRILRAGRQLSTFFMRERLWQYAAAVLMAVIVLVSVYRLGEKRGSRVPALPMKSLQSDSHVVDQQVASLTQDSQALAAKLRNRDRLIEDLTENRNHTLVEIAQLQEHDKALQDKIANAGERESHFASEREAVTQQLNSAQASLTKMEEELARMRQQQGSELIRVTDLEARIAVLTQRIKDQDDTIQEQQQLLAADRDIRELMGARDIYLAEVYDVGRYGDTQKPFGRIFFTKNKSLIFYAYDLDQQPGVRNTSAFQAWGQRGPDRNQTLSLGIFYQDNAANKRWILKVDNPKMLQQIDAVFVTVEPQGGSREPSGHRFLVASLRVEPNHP